MKSDGNGGRRRTSEFGLGLIIYYHNYLLESTYCILLYYARYQFSNRIPIDPYHGISESAFPSKVTDTLCAPINPEDVEIKPDGES